MKKLALLVSSALLMSTQAFATTDTAVLNLGATVESTCTISVTTPEAIQKDLIAAVDAGTPLTSDLALDCNSSTGFNVGIVSTNSGLTNSNDAAVKINYSVALVGKTVAETTAGALDTTGTATYAPAEFSHTAKDATLTITPVTADVTAAKGIAGIYSDTLTLTVAAI